MLIAISYQALNRAFTTSPNTRVSDCTVLILFAGIYVEATLNYIIDQMGETARMKAFFKPRHPGLHNKLAWVYNEHVAKKKASSRSLLYTNTLDAKLTRRFPGFGRLHRFRNDISHGEINRSARSFAHAQKIRRQAKDIVSELYAISSRAGFKMKRLKTYDDAVRHYGPL